MRPTPTTVRCPQCAGLLVGWAVPAYGPSWHRCPHCGAAVPVVATRDPPPLFSSEVFAPLYAPPTGPSPRRARVLTLLALVGALTLVLGLVVFLAVTGTLALGPSHETVAGRVVSSTNTILSGAVVRLTGESGFRGVMTTGFDGRFVFSNVPSGGVEINVSAPGYQPAIWQLFASPVYTSPQNMQQLDLVLRPGPTSSTALHASSSFSDLESLVATEYTGTVVLMVGAIVVVFGILSIRRTTPPGPRAAAAGGAAIGAAVALPILGVDSAFPLLDIPAIVTACLGIAAVAASCLTMATFGMSDGRAAETDWDSTADSPAVGPEPPQVPR